MSPTASIEQAPARQQLQRQIQWPRVLTRLILLLPVAVGVALRLWQNDLIPFLDDQAVLLLSAARMLDTHRLALDAGFPLQINLNEPPLVLYLDAIPMLISRSPAWISTCWAPLDAVAALLMYRATAKLSGRFAGFCAAMLFAVAPTAVFYSRGIYYSELEALCCAVALLALIDVWQRHTGISLAIAFAASCWATQLHASAATLLFVWLAVAVCTWRSLRSRWAMALGAAGGLIPLAPFLYLQTLNGWADVRAVLTFSGAAKTLDASGVSEAVAVIGGGIYRQLLVPFGQPAPEFSLDAAGWLLIALVSAGAVLAVLRHTPAHLTVLAVLLLPVLAASRHTSAVFPHYLLPALVAAIVLAGIALGALPWRSLRLILLAVVVTSQVANFLDLQRRVAADGADLSFGMPLRYEFQAARLTDALPSHERLSVSEVGNQASTFPYLTGNRFHIVESDGRYGLSLPPASASYALAQGGGRVYSFLDEHFGPVAGSVSTTVGQPAFGLFRLPPDALRAVERQLNPIHADVAHAIELRGFSAPDLEAGQPSTFLLEWQIKDAQAALPDEVQQFAHLVDASGHTISTEPDERAYPRRHWQNGDTVLTWFDLAPPANVATGGYWIETGFYGYGNNVPLLVDSGSGQPGPSLPIGPLRVGGGNPTASANPLATFVDARMALIAAKREGANVTLTWRAQGQPASDYTVFVHVLDNTGRLIGQDDSAPQAGAFPTMLWRAGDTVTDVHRLPEPPLQGAQLEVGLYTKPDLRRVPLSDGGDHLTLPAQ